MPTNRETLLCHYHYDPLDRLAACTPSAQASTRRFYLKNRLATEIQGSEQRSIFQQEDQLLAQQQHQGGTVETTLLATDQQRSVLNALNATQPHPLAYTPYGHRAPGGGLLSLLGFNGERPDPVTGHYLLGNGYRAFNPVLMRFNSPDNWSPFGKGGLNAYAYCGGEPVMNQDSTGHAFFSLFRIGLNNLIDTTNDFLRAYQAQRAAGHNAVSALSSSVNGQLLNTLGAPNPNGLSKLGAAPSNNPFTAKDGWFHSKVGGLPSSTPSRESNASLPGSSGGASMWDRLAARTQATQVASVGPNYGRSTQIAVVKPNQSTPPSAAVSGSSSAAANRPVATIQPYRPANYSSSNSTWSGESGPSDWSSGSSNSSIRRGRR